MLTEAGCPAQDAEAVNLRELYMAAELLGLYQRWVADGRPRRA